MTGPGGGVASGFLGLRRAARVQVPGERSHVDRRGETLVLVLGPPSQDERSLWARRPAATGWDTRSPGKTARPGAGVFLTPCTAGGPSGHAHRLLGRSPRATRWAVLRVWRGARRGPQGGGAQLSLEVACLLPGIAAVTLLFKAFG